MSTIRGLIDAAALRVAAGKAATLVEALPWLERFTDLILAATMLAWILLGDGVRDALDPNIRS